MFYSPFISQYQVVAVYYVSHSENLDSVLVNESVAVPATQDVEIGGQQVWG